jgi:competence protein ComEA
MALMIFLPRLFTKKSSGLSLQEDSLTLQTVDTLQTKTRQTAPDKNDADQLPAAYEPTLKNGFSEGELFPFDPNTLSPQGWQRLGLNDKTIRILVNYRNKGGRFYRPEDLKKVWTMPVGFYERVKDQIRIPESNQMPSYPTFTNTTSYNRPERKIQIVNINLDDTSAFIALPGIGPVLANRIIRFREKLGGFYSIEQVGETYGLPDSTFQKLKPYFFVNNLDIKKLNINTASKDDLNAHPYISWKLANAIIEYRNQHGNYNSLEDLLNIILMDEATFQKLSNYLSIQ